MLKIIYTDHSNRSLPFSCCFIQDTWLPPVVPPGWNDSICIEKYLKNLPVICNEGIIPFIKKHGLFDTPPVLHQINILIKVVPPSIKRYCHVLVFLWILLREGFIYYHSF